MNRNFPPSGTGPDGCATDCEVIESTACEPITCGEFEFQTPSILYAGCNCETSEEYDLYQVIDGVDCLVGQIKSSAPFQRKFEITGTYKVKWCIDACAPCGEPEYHVSPLPSATNPFPQVQKITYCNADTNTQWVKVCVFDTETPNDLTSITETLQSETDLGVSCEDIASDVEIIDRCDEDTGTLWFKTYFFTFDNDGNPTEHILSDWSDSGIKCKPDCVPYIGDSYGEASPTFSPFTSFTIIKPACCDLIVTTSAGTFTLRKGETNFTSSIFACELTSISIAGDCVDKTHIIVQS